MPLLPPRCVCAPPDYHIRYHFRPFGPPLAQVLVLVSCCSAVDECHHPLHMATPSMIHAFRLLPTNHARQDAIAALLAELTNHELRTLRDITAANPFHFDLIGHLPLELVAQIFTYLHTSSPYRLQRVSRQWRHVLQSPVVLKQTLLQWYGPDLDLRQGGYAFFERKARHLHAFRHGRPKHYLRIKVNNHHGSTLTGHTLIWKSLPHDNILYLLDMQAWELHTLVGDAREAVAHTFASSQIAGFSTFGTTVYASDLQGRGKKKFRVPNTAMTQSITCRDTIIACATFCDDYVLVFIWNYADQRGKSFTIDFESELLCHPSLLNASMNGLALLLQPKDERITVFVEGTCSDSDAANTSRSSGQWHQQSLRYSQYTYAGGYAFGTRVTDVHACQIEGTLTISRSKCFMPTDHWGTFKISVGRLEDTSQTRWVQFNENVGKFTEPRPDTHQGQMWAPSFLFCWNEIFISKSTSPFPILSHLGSRYVCSLHHVHALLG
ncbi:hypothetical protein DE146DRAFT_653787 [Phaeosphaeria sp. MPI-PUGE-AT-0046c]|nr:hypothetical protein DE146DRAFT_653787 [Phaeosphaeria sp. MPI-PUGE-AT-0046c]